jgi:uncharacterized protein with FMN-binding domain
MRRMKRAPAFIAAGAITGFTGMLIAHASAGVPLAAGSRPLAGGPATPGGSPAPGPSASSSSSPASSSPASSSSPAAHRRGGRGAGGGAHTAVGPGVNYGYGTIAVRVTVVGTRIVSVSVAGLSTLEPTSQQISTQAIPTLRSEVLAAQSATINAVSGATYTSQGYVRSLQAALFDLHV